MTYDELLIEADKLGIIVKEANLKTRDGRCNGNRIAINKKLSNVEKACVLAEELGHYHLTVGDITNQKDISNRKQELIARKWGYNKKIGVIGLINAFEHGCTNKYEIAEYLNVTVDYLDEAIKYYSNKYGVMHIIDDYIIYFTPHFFIGKTFY
ncbi:ImmA/IrrE family metallo-endopeptidase [Clostridium sp. NSJ-49]|uniref:ImmA/IrrE family metallo-endopeptidase n=1 Tax=Clostridium TaxID=1485 RepID=UPI00164BD4FA|nr:ImmA/IrrE family metallo-endopeptidase [Clostridium sp. NSJ-49]MBC5626849.1 ImmA/IrrE family metallo-endopeptidase [Clostridium sp. NSJ-49]